MVVLPLICRAAYPATQWCSVCPSRMISSALSGIRMRIPPRVKLYFCSSIFRRLLYFFISSRRASSFRVSHSASWRACKSRGMATVGSVRS